VRTPLSFATEGRRQLSQVEEVVRGAVVETLVGGVRAEHVSFRELLEPPLGQGWTNLTVAIRTGGADQTRILATVGASSYPSSLASAADLATDSLALWSPPVVATQLPLPSPPPDVVLYGPPSPPPSPPAPSPPPTPSVPRLDVTVDADGEFVFGTHSGAAAVALMVGSRLLVPLLFAVGGSILAIALAVLALYCACFRGRKPRSRRAAASCDFDALPRSSVSERTSEDASPVGYKRDRPMRLVNRGPVHPGVRKDLPAVPPPSYPAPTPFVEPSSPAAVRAFPATYPAYELPFVTDVSVVRSSPVDITVPAVARASRGRRTRADDSAPHDPLPGLIRPPRRRVGLRRILALGGAGHSEDGFIGSSSPKIARLNLSPANLAPRAW